MTCNPVRFRDENGDGLGDFLIGLASAVLDDANPVGGNKISEKAPRDNETHFKVGQTVGHAVLHRRQGFHSFHPSSPSYIFPKYIPPVPDGR